jgi:hypothetical protein
MSLERKRNKPEKPQTPPLHAAVIGGLIGATVAGMESKFELSQINSHLLSPAAITDLQRNMGATNEELSELEVRLKSLLAQELKRLRQRD